MSQSERVRRIQEGSCDDRVELCEKDKEFAIRIAQLLNHPKINRFCLVDAYYYDFSAIPRGVRERLDIWRDCYLLYGITTEGEIVSKWVSRYDLDSNDPVVDGRVVHNEKPYDSTMIPQIRQSFRADLLATAPEGILGMFGAKK